MTNEELDRLIAERVFGWVWRDSGFYEIPEGTFNGEQMDMLNEDYWRPTSNIAQAFEAVGEMIGRGWKFELESTYTNDTSPALTWRSAFDDGARTHYGHNDNPATAICLAIYNVLESEK